MYTDRKFQAYPDAKVYVEPYEEFQKMDLNDTETKHTCGQWVDLWEWPSIEAFYNHCALLHYGYERIPPRIIATKEEMLSSEDFMSCFVYGGEYNYFFKKPNW